MEGYDRAYLKKLEGLRAGLAIIILLHVCFSCNVEFIWCQEEHRNMGAWTFVNPRFDNLIGVKVCRTTFDIGLAAWCLVYVPIAFAFVTSFGFLQYGDKFQARIGFSFMVYPVSVSF